jgi:DnaJ-class molecular chaperone
MASLFEQAFGTLDFYSILQVSKDCSPSQLRKGYYKQAKQYHPDKNKSNDAKLKFQAISWAYSVLKDPTKREEYNKDGIIPHDDDDGTNEESMNSWKDYFDTIFGKLSTDDIDSFAEKYKMSEEEGKDVLENYVKFKG